MSLIERTDDIPRKLVFRLSRLLGQIHRTTKTKREFRLILFLNHEILKLFLSIKTKETCLRNTGIVDNILYFICHVFIGFISIGILQLFQDNLL